MSATTTAELPVQPLAPAARRTFGQALVEGLGGFLSLGGLFFVALSLVAVTEGLGDLKFALQDAPAAITSSTDPGTLAEDDYVSLEAPLADESIQFETLGGESFTITPVMGTSNKLLVMQSGYRTPAESQKTHLGRLVARDSSDKWDLDATRLDLIAQGARLGFKIPPDALVLMDGTTPSFPVWTLTLSALGALVLLTFCSRLLKVARLLRD